MAGRTIYTERMYRAYMFECIRLAMACFPDVQRPKVGAIVVKDGEIVGRGNKRSDPTLEFQLHAEYLALSEAGLERTRGGLLITTLEPCCPLEENHAPLRSCCEQIVDYGIKEVIFGLVDCSPTVSDAKGLTFLNENGVRTTHLGGIEYPVRQLMPRKYEENMRKLHSEGYGPD